jgi:8-oxo-dGTP diphosphatase
MPIYLVRHAKAGDREAWDQPDELRALNKGGWRQAEGIRHLLADLPLDRVLSSRYIRCLQTVEPVAADHGLPVEHAAALSEEARHEAILALLDEVSGTNAVLCTHGNVVGAVLDHVRRAGAEFDDAPHVWKKGSTWILDGENGTITRCRYVPPPT